MPPKKRPTFRLMGSAEISRRLGGISRTRVYQVTQRRNFPAPYAKLGMGNVWLADDVEEWIQRHRPELAQDPESDETGPPTRRVRALAGPGLDSP